MAEKDYISREAALQFIFDACAECMDYCEEFDGIRPDCNQCLLDGVKLKLRDLPAADVRPVMRGKWVAEKEDVEWGSYVVHYRCSNCGRLPHFDKESFKFLLSDFCPKCGADMREANNEKA
jgi:hypothetical protein